MSAGLGQSLGFSAKRLTGRFGLRFSEMTDPKIWVLLEDLIHAETTKHITGRFSLSFSGVKDPKTLVPPEEMIHAEPFV